MSERVLFSSGCRRLAAGAHECQLLNSKRCKRVGRWKSVEILITSGIPAVVSIIGFILTYFLNKRNFQEEVTKQRLNVQLEKTSRLPYHIQELLVQLVEAGNSQKHIVKHTDSMRDLLATVFAYGSRDAILLATNMQEQIYAMQRNPDSVSPYSLIAYYILLLCQVKYDLTGVEINPEFWYRMRLKDYSALKDELDRITNEIVERLNLQPFLRIGQLEKGVWLTSLVARSR